MPINPDVRAVNTLAIAMGIFASFLKNEVSASSYPSGSISCAAEVFVILKHRNKL
ncbi:MAG: hypothetical protein ACFFAF_16250 [Candidatus Hermodarchaeota archaeon]